MNLLPLFLLLFNARTVEAVRVEHPPVIDGVLDEACWLGNPGITDFMEKYPDLGEEPSESTKVVICYDEKAVYLGFFCYDSEPEKVEARLVPRESSGGDYVSVYFDTYDDDRNAYQFSINGMGIQRDVHLSGWSHDYSWNGVWRSEASLTDWGWCVEIAIPFKTLRFAPTDEQVWGLSVTRWIDHKDETVAWGDYEEGDQGTRIDRFGELTGISGIKHGLHLEFLPHLTQTARFQGPILFDAVSFVPLSDGVAGLDVKWGIASNLTLDVTTFPDYGQIEADPERINLSRYETYLSEHRPFFTEGADLFNFGYFDPVYTRRIGRKLADGSLAPIYAGGKFTGKVGGTEIGLIEVYTGQKNYDYYGTDATEEAALYSIARVKQDLFADSDVGIIVTSRDRWADDGYDGSHVAGGDFNFGFADDWYVVGEGLYSFHSDTAQPGAPMGTVGFGKSGTFNFHTNAYYSDTLADLSAVGRLNRPGYTGGSVSAGYNDSWGTGWLRSFGASAYTGTGKYLDDSLLSSNAGTYTWYSFSNNWHANLSGGVSRSYYQEDSTLRWTKNASAGFSTDYSREVAGGLWASTWDQYVYDYPSPLYFGHVIAFGPRVNWRPLDNLSVWAHANFRRIFHDDWQPDTSVYPDLIWTAGEGLRYTATRRLSFRLNLQQNTDSERYSQQLLTTWEIAPLSYLYLASSVNLTGDSTTASPFDIEVSDVTLYAKIVYLFRI